MRRREPALICVVIFAFVFAYKAAWDVRDARGMRAHSPYETTVKRIPAIARYDAIPIAVVYPGDLMDLRYYGGPALQSRLYYLADETSAVRAYGFTSGERTIYLSAPYFGTQLVDYHAFIKRQPVFYVFGGPGWLVPKLIEDGADVQVLQAGPADTLGDNLDFFFRVRIK
jgi:hypothetical protein